MSKQEPVAIDMPGARQRTIRQIVAHLEDELEPEWSATDKYSSDYRSGIGRALVAIRALRGEHGRG